MKKTFLSRISNLKQYNADERTILWKDTTESRWSKVYSELEAGDNAIFITTSQLLIGEVKEVSIKKKLVSIDKVEEYLCSNDQFLQLNEIYPEMISRVKASFNPFIHPIDINIDNLKNEIKSKAFISFYIFKDKETLDKNLSILKNNDRLIILDENGKFQDIELFSPNGLSSAKLSLALGTQGLTLNDVLKRNELIPKHGKRSNNVNRIIRINEELRDKGIFKFNTFFSYYDALFNKRVYGADTSVNTMPNDKPINDKNNENLELQTVLNQILYGPPGTGKTYSTINKAISIIDKIDEEQLHEKYPERATLKKRFNDLIITDWDDPKGQICFTTFHQSMSYEDFIEGIKPGASEEQRIVYDIEPGIFKRIANIAKDNWFDYKNKTEDFLPFEGAFEKLKAEWDENQSLPFPMKTEGKEYTIFGFTQTSIRFKKSNGGTNHTLSISTLRDYYYGRRDVRTHGLGIYYPPLISRLKSYQSDNTVKKSIKNFVLIIDEINRGNISQIFGELITLIEDDKRIDKEEAIEAILAYSKEKLCLTPNLFIVGTMNTADRSIEALDTALRRRFTFYEMQPKPNLIKEIGKSKGFIEEIDLVKLLETINNRIEILIDKDHMIGHSYLLNCETIEDLQTAFKTKIIPLLEEYFYNDFGKLGLVLGDKFIEDKNLSKKFSFAKFNLLDNEVIDDLSSRRRYQVTASATWDASSFISIYQ